MAFWNRERNKKGTGGFQVDGLTRAILTLRGEVAALRDDVAALQARMNQPVPTNGQRRAGGVQEWLPVLDRLQELLLVQMGNPDLAQAFGTHARQREMRAAEEPETTWVEPNESTYETL